MGLGKCKYSILYFLDYGKDFGGAANTLIQQAILMRKEGHEVIFFLSDYYGGGLSEEYAAKCLNTGIACEWATYHVTSQPEDIDIVCIDENYERMRDKVSSYRPDILHSVQLNPSVELISRELGIPHIMNIYPLIPEFFTLKYMNIFPHYHICDSWFWAQEWNKYLGTDSVCIRTVVNREKPREKHCFHQLLRFICVGAVYKEKNQLAVIQAFHNALRLGIQGTLTICGYAEGDYGNICISYIEEHNLQNVIAIKGFCSDMDTEYLQSDILICGSTRESYPNVISEAMARGLVIISTPVGGVPEVIDDGENGYLTEDYSAEAISDKIIQVQKDILSGKIRTILAEAERTFIEEHSIIEVKKKLINYYEYVKVDYKERYAYRYYKELPNVECIRKEFKELIEIFNRKKWKFAEPRKIALKLWYLYYVRNALNSLWTKESEIYIWGTGKYGVAAKGMMEEFLPEFQLNGYLDSKKNGCFLGKQIFNPTEILKKRNVIIFVAAVNGQDEILEMLEEKKMIFNKDYFILSARRW